MSEAATLLDALSSEPATTDELYDRVGYITLTRLGLVSYRNFRAALAQLERDGSVASDVAPDGSTRWWLLGAP